MAGDRDETDVLPIRLTPRVHVTISNDGLFNMDINPRHLKSGWEMRTWHDMDRKRLLLNLSMSAGGWKGSMRSVL